jgi:UBX domain
MCTHPSSLPRSDSKQAAIKGFDQAVAVQINVDASKPKATVQIVLADRKRVRQEFNMTHTIFDVYQHVKWYASSAFCFCLLKLFIYAPTHTLV